MNKLPSRIREAENAQTKFMLACYGTDELPEGFADLEPLLQIVYSREWDSKPVEVQTRVKCRFRSMAAAAFVAKDEAFFLNVHQCMKFLREHRSKGGTYADPLRAWLIILKGFQVGRGERYDWQRLEKLYPALKTADVRRNFQRVAKDIGFKIDRKPGRRKSGQIKP